MFVSEILTEGLIAVPPKMAKEIEFYLEFYLLWWARDRFKGKTRELSEQYKAFKNLVKKLEQDIPKEPFRPTHKNICVQSINLNLSGMPSSYSHLNPSVKSIWFIIDMHPGRQLGGWLSKNKTLGVYPLTLDYLARYPCVRSHPDDLEIALRELKETIRHELKHMVQDVLIQHPDQLKTKPKYTDYKSDYFTSPIEFDPTIGSCVEEFKLLWDTYNNARKNSLGKSMSIQTAIKRFVDITPSSQFDLLSAHKFFKYLKQVAPVRYKKAVKKFIQELNDSSLT